VLLEVIRDELLAIKEEFGDERRTEIRTTRKTSTSST
jgi:DNA gyrase/topoisomerase IV subunit A